MSALATYGYRKGTVGRPGYQGLPQKPPANDNFPWRRIFDPGNPANDNQPKAKPGSSAAFLRRYALRAGIGKALVTAYDLYQWYQGYTQAPTTEINTAVYTRADCGQGTTPFYHYGFIQGRGTSCGVGALKSELKIEPVAQSIVPEWQDALAQPLLAIRVAARWIKNAPSSDPFYIQSPAQAYPNVWPYVAPFPSLNPMELPILQPAPQPKPVPWRFAPYPRPNPERETGPIARKANWARQRPAPWHPSRGKAWDVMSGKAVSPAGRTPPAKGERHVKLHMQMPKGIKFAVNAVTEGIDFAQALWHSIPKKLRSRGVGGREPNFPTKLRDIYWHINDVEWHEFWMNYAQNQSGDRLGGILGGFTRDANQATGHKGLGIGPAL